MVQERTEETPKQAETKENPHEAKETEAKENPHKAKEDIKESTEEVVEEKETHEAEILSWIIGSFSLPVVIIIIRILNIV